MGITIHYKGYLAEGEKRLIPRVLAFVEEKARKCGYAVERFSYKGYVVKNRLLNTSGEIVREWDSFVDKLYGSQDGSRSRIVGVHVKNATSEWFTCAFYFNPESKRFEWGDFTKTQAFDKKEALPNIRFHLFIIRVLVEIKLRFVENLEISDEGEYFFTEKQRVESIDYFSEKCKDVPEYAKCIDYWKRIEPFDVKTLVQSHGENLDLISGRGSEVVGELKRHFAL